MPAQPGKLQELVPKRTLRGTRAAIAARFGALPLDALGEGASAAAAAVLRGRDASAGKRGSWSGDPLMAPRRDSGLTRYKRAPTISPEER